MSLKNYMEEAAREALESVLQEDAHLKGCERCKLDILALMLNDLPPRYIVREKGYLYAKINQLRAQFKVDLTVAAYNAMEKVKQSPRH